VALAQPPLAHGQRQERVAVHARHAV
jgi:hypothetical protein